MLDFASRLAQLVIFEQMPVFQSASLFRETGFSRNFRRFRVRKSERAQDEGEQEGERRQAFDLLQ